MAAVPPPQVNQIAPDLEPSGFSALTRFAADHSLSLWLLNVGNKLRSFVNRRWSWKRTGGGPFLTGPALAMKHFVETRGIPAPVSDSWRPFHSRAALEVAAKMIAQEKPESLVGQQLSSYQILSLLVSVSVSEFFAEGR